MALLADVRGGRGPIWMRLKRAARIVLTIHLPTFGPLRSIYRCGYAVHVAVREIVIWSLRFLWYEPLFRSQCEVVGAHFRMEKLPYLTGRGSISIGNYVTMSGKPTITFGNRTCVCPSITIGDGTFIGHNTTFEVARMVTIGGHCLIAAGVTIRDYDGHPLDAESRRRNEPQPATMVKPVVIGDDVWIGQHALILKGVQICDRAIVASHAVVTKDVPADSIVAGNPARVVRWLGSEAAVREQATDIMMSQESRPEFFEGSS